MRIEIGGKLNIYDYLENSTTSVKFNTGNLKVQMQT